MRKIISYLCVLAVGGLLFAPVVVRADHVHEPQHAISDFELVLEDYANNDEIDCTVVETIAFRKIRIQPLAESAAAWAAPNNTGVPGHHDPSEHFSTGWTIEQRIQNPNKPNVFNWVMEEHTVWAHSNIPGDTESSKFNVAYATISPGQPNGGSSTMLDPGRYRVIAQLLTDETETHFVETCEFVVT